MANSAPTADTDRLEVLYREAVRAGLERLSPRLEDVYVELKVIAEVSVAQDEHSAAELRLLRELEYGALLQDIEQVRELDSLRYRRWKQQAWSARTRRPPRSIEATMAETGTPALVLLGDPGSGKTTLLHFLALRALRTTAPGAGLLPIFVPLAAYDECLRHGPIPLEEFLAIYCAKWRGLPGLAPLFQRALAEGRALLLLDGLDEPLSVEARRAVAEQVDTLIQRWGPAGNRLVLTSRFIGYREVRLSSAVPHFMVVDFAPEDVERFAHRWCLAMELDLPRAQAQARALLADIREKPGVAHLASNPLLLTMLAQMRRQGPLPERRADLYACYVRALIDGWERGRGSTQRTRAPERLVVHEVESRLMDLALWMHRHRPSGTASRTDLALVLGSLDEVRDISGLLGERGPDAHGFLHLTFQEYFVGKALARESPDVRWEWLRPHLHDPRWREPVLLCAGHLAGSEGRRQEAEALLESILAHGSDYEEVLYRGLLLSMDILAEDVTRSPRLLEAMRVRLEALAHSGIRSLRERALSGMARLTRLGLAPAGELLLRWWREWEFPCGSARLLMRLLPDSGLGALRDEALARLELPDLGVNDQAKVIHTLRELVTRDPQVCQAMVDAFESAHFESCRGYIIESLGPVAEQDERVRRVLLDYLDDPSMDSHLSQLLGSLAVRDASMRQTLLERLDDTNSRSVVRVVEALGRLADQDAEVREALSSRLGDPNPDVRCCALNALGQHGCRDEQMRRRFLSRVADSDHWVRIRAVEALRRIVDPDEQVCDAMITLLKDESDRLSDAAAIVLGMCAKHHPRARQVLLTRLNHVDTEVRLSSIEALAPIAEVDAEVRHALCLQLDDDDLDLRWKSLQVLVLVAREDEQVHQCLVGVLDEEGYPRGRALADALSQDELRLHVSDTLSSLAAADVRVRQSMLARLDDPFPPVRSDVSWALAPQAGQDEQVRQAMLSRLDDPLGSVRAAAVFALSPLADGDEQVRRGLLARLDDPDQDVRWRLFRGLESVVGKDPLMRRALLARFLDASYDENSRGEIVRLLGPVVKSDEQVRQALLDWLSTAVTSKLASKVREALSGQEVRPAQGPAAPSPPPRAPRTDVLKEAPSWREVIANGDLARVLPERWARQKTLSSRRGLVGQVVDALQASDTDDPEVVTLLLPWLMESSKVADYLAQRAAHDAPLREQLMAQLRHPEWRRRLGAAAALGSMPGGLPGLAPLLYSSVLEDCRDVEFWTGRLEASEILLNARAQTVRERALSCALSALDYGIGPEYDEAHAAEVRGKAVEILGTLEPLYREEWVLRRLMRLLQEDGAGWVREVAYHAVLRLLAAPAGAAARA